MPWCSGESAFPGSGQSSGLKQENRRLRTENERPRMKRETVRPATSIVVSMSV